MSCAYNHSIEGLTLLNRNPLETHRADVGDIRANQAVIRELFDDVGSPTDDAAHREQRWEHIDIQVNGIEQDGAVVIDVGV